MLRRREFLSVLTAGAFSAGIGSMRAQTSTLAEQWKQRAKTSHRIAGVRSWHVNLNPVTMSSMGFSRLPLDPTGKQIHIPPGPKGTHVDWRGPFAAQAGALMVEITTDRGLKGYGLGGGGAAGGLIIDRHMKYFLLDRDPLDVEEIWDHIYHVTSIYGRRGLLIYALSGVDLALWDLCGKILEAPVYSLVTDTPRLSVPAYATGTDPAYYASQGFTACKMPLRSGLPQGEEGLQANLEMVSQARQAVGEDVNLMVDAYLRWDVDYTLRFASAAEEFKLKWIEESIALDDYEGMARLVREIDPTWVVSGEHEFTRYGFRELMRWKAADMVQPDISWAGGFGECLKIGREAAEKGISTWPHQGGTPWGLHLIAALPLPCRAEAFGPSRQAAENELFLALRPQPREGVFEVDDRPGFGVDISEQLLRTYMLESWG